MRDELQEDLKRELLDYVLVLSQTSHPLFLQFSINLASQSLAFQIPSMNGVILVKGPDTFRVSTST